MAEQGRDPGGEHAEASIAATTSTATSAAFASERANPKGFADRSATAPLTAAEIVLARALAKARYHEDRESFVGWIMRGLNFLVLVSGTAAFASLTQADAGSQPKLIAAATAIIGAVQLVFDLPGLMRTHMALRKVAIEVAAEATRQGADLEALSLKLIMCAAEAPATYHALEALAYNAAQEALGRPEGTLLVVPWWHRRLRNIRRFTGGYRCRDEIAKQPKS